MCIRVAHTHSCTHISACSLTCTQHELTCTHSLSHVHTVSVSLSVVRTCMLKQSLSHVHTGQGQCSSNCCVTCLTSTVNPRHGLIPDMVLFVFDSSGASLSPRGQPKRLGFSSSLSMSPPPPATPTTLTPSSTPSPTSIIPPLSRNVASSESKMDESGAEVATPKQIRFAEPET